MAIITLLTVFVLSAVTVRAELVSLDSCVAEPFAGGKRSATSGPTNASSASPASPSIPNHAAQPAHRRSGLAPRNADGKVEFEADVLHPRPERPGQGQRRHLLRRQQPRQQARPGLLQRRARAATTRRTAADAGNGFLFRRGYTVVWCGWIGELLPGDDRLLLRAPIAARQRQADPRHRALRDGHRQAGRVAAPVAPRGPRQLSADRARAKPKAC